MLMNAHSKLRSAGPDLPNAYSTRDKMATLPFQTSGPEDGLSLQKKKQVVKNKG